MEGVLLKWTNYLSGWQPRWFILDNGVLSYYKSQEDVNNGCKGSVKVAACDIVVNPTDVTRFDLTIPGEQQYYVKASTAQERQSWLIALGSSKAAFNETSDTSKRVEAVPDVMRSKQSELRLNCSLLIQQVQAVKQAASSSSDGKLDFQKLAESASLIAATCDSFIAALNDCMKLVSSVSSNVHDAAVSPWTRGTRSVIARLPEKPSHYRQSSVSFSDGIRVHTSSSHHSGSATSSPGHQRSKLELFPSTLQSSGPSPPVDVCETNTVSKITPLQRDVNGSLSCTVEHVSPLVVATPSSEDAGDLEKVEEVVGESSATFFSAMPTSFADVDTSQEDCILVIPFLDACKNLVPIFDKLNTSALTPVKMDFCGNIRKIQQKHESCHGRFQTLQSLVLNEVANNQHLHSDSATSALLWLKRSLEFISEFLQECLSDCMDIGMCASNAYSRTLQQYHGWIVRGVFAVAVRALPYRETFISHLGVEDNPKKDTSQSFEQALLRDIDVFVLHLRRVLQVINDFYIKHSLDSSKIV